MKRKTKRTTTKQPKTKALKPKRVPMAEWSDSDANETLTSSDYANLYEELDRSLVTPHRRYQLQLLEYNASVPWRVRVKELEDALREIREHKVLDFDLAFKELGPIFSKALREPVDPE